MFLGACRRRRRRGGWQLYQLWAAWGATGQLSAFDRTMGEGEGAKRVKVSEVLFGARRRARARSAARSRGAEGAELPREARRVQLRAHVSAAGEGAEAMCSSTRVGEGEGAEAGSSTNFGRPGALLGSSVAFGSGCG